MNLFRLHGAIGSVPGPLSQIKASKCEHKCDDEVEATAQIDARCARLDETIEGDKAQVAGLCATSQRRRCANLLGKYPLAFRYSKSVVHRI